MSRAHWCIAAVSDARSWRTAENGEVLSLWRPKAPASVREACVAVLGFAVLAVTCSACWSKGSSTSAVTSSAFATASNASAASQAPRGVGPGRFSPCPSTNDGRGSLPFLGPKPPAHQPPLLPDGAEAALVCRYAGVGESRPAGALVVSVQIGAAQAATLVSLLDVDVPLDLTKMPPSCPSNSGSIFALQFAYPQGRVVTATSSLDGCAWTVVGNRAVWTSSAALQALRALAGGQVANNLLGPQPS
jgi:hypothetical protein